MNERKIIAQIKDPTKWLNMLYGVFLMMSFLDMSLADLYLGSPTKNVSCAVHDAKYACDCGYDSQTMQLPFLSGSVYELEISNCKALVIEANSLDNLNGLRKINFHDIDNLVLQKYALAYSRYASSTPLIIEFKKVAIDVIDSHALNGNIEEIHFISGRIRVIHPFAFTTFKERAALIKLEGIWIGKIEAQAFKRVTIGKFEILNCQFETNVPSKAFYEVEVLESFTVTNNRFREVHTKAFEFKKISKLTMTSNYFDKNDAAWIEAQVMESIDFRNNYFGYTNELSFKGMSVHRDYIKSDLIELRFFNNTVHFEAETRPLEFNARLLANIKNLRYENRYNCKNLNYEVKPPQPSHKFFQKHADSIFFQTAAENAKNFNQNQSYVVLDKIIETDCRPRSYLFYIILGAISLVILLIVVAIVVYCKWAQGQKQRKMDVVMPEPRTYKETQIVYQIENAELLKTDL